MRSARWFPVSAICWLVLAGGIAGAEPAQMAAGDFLVQVWTQDDGVPRNSVTGFAQGADGYLWMVSDQAVARFDGLRFVEAQSERLAPTREEWQGPLRYVRRLFGSGSGSVWLGTSASDLWRWNGAQFELWFPKHTSSRGFLHVLELEGQEVLAFTRAGRCLRGGKDGVVQVASLGRQENPRPESVHLDGMGQVWFVTRRGRVGRIHPVKGLEWPWSAQPAGVRAEALCIDLRGRIWLGADTGLFAWRESAFEKIPSPVPDRPFPVRAVLASGRDALWVASGERAWRWQGGGWQGPLGEWPDSVPEQARLVDRAGRLWLAPPGQGLHCLRSDGTSVRLGPEDGLTADATALFCDREGNLWASIYRTGIARIRARRFRLAQVTDGLHTTPIWNVAEDARGAIWFSAEFKGPVRWREGQETEVEDAEAGIDASGWTKALTVDRLGRAVAAVRGIGVVCSDGEAFRPVLPWPRGAGFTRVLFQDSTRRWWMGSDFGLRSWVTDRWRRWGEADGLPGDPVRAVVEDGNGRLWVGTFGGGLARLEGERFVRFGQKDGLPDDSVYVLCPGSDGSLWIGTEGGLGQWKSGRFATFRTEQGLPDNRVVQILEDGQGHLWAGTRDGLCRITLISLEAVAERRENLLDCTVFDRDDGLPTRAFQDRASPACWRTRDGQLWFLTAGGAIHCRPESIRLNPVGPPVQIEQVVLDGRDQTAPTNSLSSPAQPFAAVAAFRPGSIKFPAGPRTLEIRFAARSLAAPERVSYRYKMEGLDRDWVQADDGQAAIYSSLPPGRYRFRVRASNHDGVWDETGAELGVVVEPHLWQMSWFPSAVGATLAGLVGVTLSWMQRVRRRRQLARLELRRAKEAERTRISRDLHDHLGATLTEIGMLAEDANGSATPPGSARCPGRVLKEKVHAAVTDLDALVWVVDPRQDTLASLVGYLASFVEEYVARSNLHCRIDLPRDLPDWALSSEVRHNLFLAVKEAVHNAVRHAAATEVVFQVRRIVGHLQIAVTDNGTGFDPASVTRGNGLANLRERLALLGGFCEISTKPGLGTTVSFSLPIPLLKSTLS